MNAECDCLEGGTSACTFFYTAGWNPLLSESLWNSPSRGLLPEKRSKYVFLKPNETAQSHIFFCITPHSPVLGQFRLIWSHFVSFWALFTLDQ